MMCLSAREAAKLAADQEMDLNPESAIKALTNKQPRFNQKQKKDERKSISVAAKASC